MYSSIVSRGLAVGRVSDTVLTAQFLFQRFVHLIDGQILGNFEVAASRFAREPLEHLSAVLATPAAAAHASVAAKSDIAVGVLEQDRVDQSVGALRRFDGF